MERTHCTACLLYTSTAPEEPAPDTGTEETGTTQSGASANAADPAQNTQDGEEVLP